MRTSRRPRPSASAASQPDVPAATNDRELTDKSSPANDSSTPDKAVSPARVSVQRHLSRPTFGKWQINRTVLLLIISLALLGGLSLINQRVIWPTAVQTWWPLSIIGVAALWFIGALFRHSANGWLFSTVLLGLAISLLLSTAYSMSFGVIWLGVGLITIGAGTLLRGLLWGAR